MSGTEYTPEALEGLVKALTDQGYTITKAEAPAPEIHAIEEAPAPEIHAIEEAPPIEIPEPQAPPAPEVNAETWIKNIKTHVESCPDCYNDLYTAVYKGDAECADCGLPLGSHDHRKALESCPNCKGTNAK